MLSRIDHEHTASGIIRKPTTEHADREAIGINPDRGGFAAAVLRAEPAGA